MSDSSNSRASGVGVTGLLGVAFIVLKLCKVIDWSWWWVLSPFWIPLCIVAVLLLAFGFCRWRIYRIEAQMSPADRALSRLRRNLSRE